MKTAFATLILMSGVWAIARAPTTGPSTAPTDLTPLVEQPDQPAVRSSAGPGTPVNKGWVEFHEAMVKRVHASQPDDPIRAKIRAANDIIAKLADNNLIYLDIGTKLLSEDGTLPKEVAPDGLHPGLKGYEIWAGAILPTLQTMLSSSH
jgi:hypothetical protein